MKKEYIPKRKYYELYINLDKKVLEVKANVYLILQIIGLKERIEFIQN